jgi:C1A family cysteine protease
MQAPISVSIDADNSAVENYVSGVIIDSNICGTNLDHAVTVVGYNATGFQPYWIVRNSWGPDWGEDGYFKILMSDGTGVCGINLDVTFPNMALAFGQ